MIRVASCEFHKKQKNMNLLTQYREKLHLKEVERGINQVNRNASGNFTGFHSVGILLEATNKEVVQKALAFIKKFKKEAETVKILAYVDVKELKEDFPFDCFCKKELDWIWRPKGVLASKFKLQKFDLLINLCQTDCFPLEYLAVSIEANYKIGALTDYPNNYDLMLDTKNFDNYLKQVDFFLAKFNCVA